MTGILIIKGSASELSDAAALLVTELGAEVVYMPEGITGTAVSHVIIDDLDVAPDPALEPGADALAIWRARWDDLMAAPPPTPGDDGGYHCPDATPRRHPRDNGHPKRWRK